MIGFAWRLVISFLIRLLWHVLQGESLTLRLSFPLSREVLPALYSLTVLTAQLLLLSPFALLEFPFMKLSPTYSQEVLRKGFHYLLFPHVMNGTARHREGKPPSPRPSVSKSKLSVFLLRVHALEL